MYVYVIRSKKNVEAPIKVGKSKNPAKRLSALQTGNAEKLGVLHLVQCRSDLHAMEIERELHRKLGPYREKGEWYKPYALHKFREIMNSMNYYNKKRISPAIKCCWKL